MIDHSERPWGRWIKTDEGENFWVKKIEVNPGCRLSLQSHTLRSEVWTIVQGSGYITVGEEVLYIESKMIANIPVGTIHRIHNTGNIPLIFIEVALGTCREDDIARYEDDYGRVA